MVAVALLAVVIANLIHWFRITAQYDTFEEMVPAYLSVFPSWLQNARIITMIDIFLLGISGFIFAQAIKVNYLKVLSIIFAGLTSLLILWQVFSLM
ncbi:hypothetical protein DEU42_11027 [Flavobacterium sp. AG291]|nr:hypothetical protein DEU42_11027 [Flavobacterium sp. AG291]